MKSWTGWHKRAVTAKLLSGKTDKDISLALDKRTSRKAGRAQVNHWFTGTREPTISQFLILCEEIGADPGQILFDVPLFKKQ